MCVCSSFLGGESLGGLSRVSEVYEAHRDSCMDVRRLVYGLAACTVGFALYFAEA